MLPDVFFRGSILVSYYFVKRGLEVDKPKFELIGPDLKFE